MKLHKILNGQHHYLEEKRKDVTKTQDVTLKVLIQRWENFSYGLFSKTITCSHIERHASESHTSKIKSFSLKNYDRRRNSQFYKGLKNFIPVSHQTF
jgi:hypothetical protein